MPRFPRVATVYGAAAVCALYLLLWSAPASALVTGTGEHGGRAAIGAAALESRAAPACDPYLDSSCGSNCDTSFDPDCDSGCDTTIDPHCGSNCDTSLDPDCDPSCDPTLDPSCDTDCDPDLDPGLEPTCEPTSEPTDYYGPTYYGRRPSKSSDSDHDSGSKAVEGVGAGVTAVGGAAGAIARASRRRKRREEDDLGGDDPGIGGPGA